MNAILIWKIFSNFFVLVHGSIAPRKYSYFNGIKIGKSYQVELSFLIINRIQYQLNHVNQWAIHSFCIHIQFKSNV